MARPLPCDSNDGTEAVILISNLGDGSVLTLCGVCFASWLVGMVDALGLHDPQGGAEAASAATEAPQEGEAAPDPPRPKRRRRGRENGSGDADWTVRAEPDGEPIPGEEVPPELTAPQSPFADAAPDHS